MLVALKKAVRIKDLLLVSKNWTIFHNTRLKLLKHSSSFTVIVLYSLECLRSFYPLHEVFEAFLFIEKILCIHPTLSVDLFLSDTQTAVLCQLKLVQV